MAKKMAFEFGGFSNLTDTFTANLTIDLGAWTKPAASSSDATNSFESQKTYIVTSEITLNADVTEITGTDHKRILAALAHACSSNGGFTHDAQ